MSTKISGPGSFECCEDIHGNLEVEGNDITLRGNMRTVFGWLHVTGDRIKISNLILSPQNLILSSRQVSGCQVCNKTGFVFDGEISTSTCIAVCNSDGVDLENIKLDSPVPLSCLAEVAKDSTAVFENCTFNGKTFNDPPSSEFVIRH